MSLSGFFRQRAAECIRLAQRAHNSTDHDFFLELARAWLGLNREFADRPPRNDDEKHPAPAPPAAPTAPSAHATPVAPLESDSAHRQLH
jgi:hypothetical protein